MDLEKKNSLVFRIRAREHANGMVQIEDAEEDRFLMKVEAVIQACKIHASLTEVSKQVRKLDQRLEVWVKANAHHINDAFFKVREHGLFFFVVSKSKTYNRELERSLTELDIEVANDEGFSLIQMSVHAVPNVPEESYQAF